MRKGLFEQTTTVNFSAYYVPSRVICVNGKDRNFSVGTCLPMPEYDRESEFICVILDTKRSWLYACVRFRDKDAMQVILNKRDKLYYYPERIESTDGFFKWFVENVIKEPFQSIEFKITDEVIVEMAVSSALSNPKIGFVYAIMWKGTPESFIEHVKVSKQMPKPKVVHHTTLPGILDYVKGFDPETDACSVLICVQKDVMTFTSQKLFRIMKRPALAPK